MKKTFTILFILASMNGHAFINCKSETTVKKGIPLFSVNIYEGAQIKALVTDQRVSKISRSFICEKTTVPDDGELNSTYDCFGGDFGKEFNVAFFLNEENLMANYINEENEENDLENLICTKIES